METEQSHDRKQGATSLIIPGATVFISGFCIMVLEIVATRIIARHLGSSLYTWTSVIGIVLAGISLGNYLGGRIADRFHPRKALTFFFMFSSAACVLVIVFNNLVGDWIVLYQLEWPTRVFTHVFVVFMLPSTLLGTISPVVAKMALEQGLATGRTVGSIYAWGAIGSIAGTFAAGYFLIPLVGTTAIVWIVAGILLVMGILYCFRLWPFCLWILFFLAAAVLANVPFSWCHTAAAAIALREKANPQLIYQDETAYSYLAVTRKSQQPEKRALILDKLTHSTIVMEDITDLQYFYTKIYAVVTDLLKPEKEDFSILVIGGGGYVYPRYVKKIWPQSRIEVVEIDPDVTKAAIEAFGMDPNTRIRTLTMDARNYVDQLLQAGQTGTYDFIYEDAINDFTVPFQLITKEFNDKIAALLTDNGAYIITLIDTYDEGRFLATVVNTLRQTFPDVYVITQSTLPKSVRNTFVIVAGKKQLNLTTLLPSLPQTDQMWCLTFDQMDKLTQKAEGVILTDDYAPVENLLVSVVRQSAKGFLALRYFQEAGNLARKGKLEKSITTYKKAAEVQAEVTIDAFNEIGLLYASQNDHSNAAEAFKEAIEYHRNARPERNLATTHFNLGIALQNLENHDEAKKHFQQAVEDFQKSIKKYPDSALFHAKLANALIGLNEFDAAASSFQRAIELDPTDVTNYIKLIELLESKKQYDQAIASLDKLIEYLQNAQFTQSIDRLRRYREFLEFRKYNASKNATE